MFSHSSDPGAVEMVEGSVKCVVRRAWKGMSQEPGGEPEKVKRRKGEKEKPGTWKVEPETPAAGWPLGSGGIVQSPMSKVQRKAGPVD